MLTVSKSRIIFSQGNNTIAILLQPVTVNLTNNILTLSSNTTLTINLETKAFNCETKGFIDEFELSQIKQLLKSDPQLQGKQRSFTFYNKQGYPVTWVKKGLTGLPEITSISNPKLTRKILTNCIFKLGLHTSVSQLRTLLSSREEDFS